MLKGENQDDTIVENTTESTGGKENVDTSNGESVHRESENRKSDVYTGEAGRLQKRIRTISERTSGTGSESRADEIGGTVKREDIGNIILNRKGVKSSITHGIGRKKAIAFKAVPDVIKKGVVIDQNFNYKERGYDNITIAAPIVISKKLYHTGVVVNENDRISEFYLHEVSIIKRDDDSSFKTETRKGYLSDVTSSLNGIITQPEVDVQEKMVKNDDVHTVAENFGLDETLLRELVDSKPTEDNINDWGKFDNLIETVDKAKAKAKAYWEQVEGETVPPHKVSMKTDLYLRDFITGKVGVEPVKETAKEPTAKEKAQETASKAVETAKEKKAERSKIMIIWILQNCYQF